MINRSKSIRVLIKEQKMKRHGLYKVTFYLISKLILLRCDPVSHTVNNFFLASCKGYKLLLILQNDFLSIVGAVFY